MRSLISARILQPWLVAVFVLGLVAAGCGGDDDTEASASDAATETGAEEGDAETTDDAPGTEPDDEEAGDEDPGGDEGTDPEGDDAVVTGTDGCDDEAVDTANWSALAAGAEEGEFGAAGATAGFQNLDRAADGVGSISLIQRGRAHVILHLPIEVLAEGGAFDLSEPLPGLEANAVLLSEFEAPVEGTLQVCVADNGGVNGVFEVTATSVIDDETVVMQGEFNGLLVAE